jgi:preprotein translocase subunit SecA
MLRWELTGVEQMVLLNAFDQVWKDHMYSMQLVRESIWMRSYAEKDPKIEYKREGTRLFDEMQKNVRERVTDSIFRVQIASSSAAAAEFHMGGTGAALGPVVNGGMAYGRTTSSKADSTNAGFSEADREAALRKQGDQQPKTVRREAPKVGRNDPCPCGSGKKYKQCHGKTG